MKENPVIQKEMVNDSDSRASLVDSFFLHSTRTAQEKQGLVWIPFGTALAIGRIKTQGGFYLQESGGSQCSFAVDPDLQIGNAQNARPFRLRPGARVKYAGLDPDQRALFLHVLAGRKAPLELQADFCARLLAQMLEWRLFFDKHEPRQVALDGIDLADRLNSSSRRRLLKVLAWSAFFSGPDFHLAVIEGLLEEGARFLDASPLHLALHDCATEKRPVWAKLALAVECVFGLGFERWANGDFKGKFLKQFQTEYPGGIGVEVGSDFTLVEYRPQCPELRALRCRFSLPDVLQQGALPSALRQLARRQFPGRTFATVEPQVRRPEQAQTVGVSGAVVDGPAQDHGDEPREIRDYEAAKDFVLEHAPLMLPLRFLFGNIDGPFPRIEATAAAFLFLEGPWRGDLQRWQIGMLQKCFGLTIERHCHGWSYRAKSWKWFPQPTSQRAINLLEDLWHYEHVVRSDLEQTREALKAIYKQRRVEEPLPGRTANALHRQIRDLRSNCEVLAKRFRALIIQQAGLMERITGQRDFPPAVEEDYREAPGDTWLTRMNQIAVEFFSPGYVDERVRCAEYIFSQSLDFFRTMPRHRSEASPSVEHPGADLLQHLLIQARRGSDGVASELLYPPRPLEWIEAASAP